MVASKSQEKGRASLSRLGNYSDWITDDLRRGAIPRISQVSCRRLLRQQRNAILFLFGEYPDPAFVDDRGPIASAQRRARHDPLPPLSCVSLFRLVLPQAAIGLIQLRGMPRSCLIIQAPQGAQFERDSG